MSPESPRQASHRIAAEAATTLIKNANAAGIGWVAMAITVETALVIEVATLVSLSDAPDKLRLAA
jgi:hypothetical protein